MVLQQRSIYIHTYIHTHYEKIPQTGVLDQGRCIEKEVNALESCLQSFMQFKFCLFSNRKY